MPVPTWTAPPTKANGDTITAADWNTAADNARWLYWRPAAIAWRTSATSVAPTTWTTISFDSEKYDPYGFHSTSSNTSRLTVPSGLAGTYRICAQWGSWAGSAAGLADVTIRLNGATDIAWNSFLLGAGGLATGHVSTHYDLVAGDYVEVRVYHVAAAAASIPSDHLGPLFSISHLGTT